MLRPDSADLVRLVARFSGRRVLVVGDLVADEYVYGRPTRVSREAPVLILRHSGDEIRLGGAANACHNLHTLGARVIPLGVVGEDAAGEAVRALFSQRGIPSEGIVTVAGRTTPIKTRILAGGAPSTQQQLVRIDREPTSGIPPRTEARLLECLAGWADTVDAVVLSDYGYGTITARLLDHARGLAVRGVVVSADSRYDLLRFQGVTAATPSEPEVEQLLGLDLEGDKAVELAGWRLLERLEARLLLVTRGSRGLVLFEPGTPAVFIPVHGGDEVADVTGAGDTVIGTFTLALAAAAPPQAAARLANYAGGIVVTKRGTATVAQEELFAAIAADLRTRADDERATAGA